MRIAIVDDLETERAQLRLFGAEAELLEFESGESFLAAEKEQRFTAQNGTFSAKVMLCG